MATGGAQGDWSPPQVPARAVSSPRRRKRRRGREEEFSIAKGGTVRHGGRAGALSDDDGSQGDSPRAPRSEVTLGSFLPVSLGAPLLNKEIGRAHV